MRFLVSKIAIDFPRFLCRVQVLSVLAPHKKQNPFYILNPNFKYSAIAFTHSSSSSGVPEMLHPAAFKR